MNKIDLFIKEKNIKFSEIEEDLNLPRRCIQKERGVPKKHREVVISYLEEKYGYRDDNPEKEVDEPLSRSISVKKKIWNEGMMPNYKDGILRYRDPGNGLWKRLVDHQSQKDKESGRRVIKDEYKPVEKVFNKDEIGEYYVAKNGTKVYTFKDD